MYRGPQIKRLRFVMTVMMLLWVVLWCRVGVIQGLRFEKYRKRADDQRIKPVDLPGKRGTIMDCNGESLAFNITSSSYELRPNEIEDIERTSRILSTASGKSVSHVKSLITSGREYCWLVRQAEKNVVALIDRLEIKGLRKLQEFRRYYPNNGIGAQMLGYCDVDGKGIEGCELYLNDVLVGHDGRSVKFMDAFGRSALSLDRPAIEPEDGCDVVLTIDSRIQEIADEELIESVTALDAIWGGAIVLDTGTGGIIAMSNVPQFNPNNPASYDNDTSDPNRRRNRIVTDMVEPGSTMKIVTFIEALESGVLTEDDPIDCENGKFRIGRHTINDTHELGIVPASDVLIHSSNIGAVKIAEKIGKQKLYQRARLLGFGTVTGIDVPDETGGDLPHPKTWSKLTLPTMSYGHGVAVSPIQLAMSYAAIANGGLLLRPFLVGEVIGNDERPGRKSQTRTIRRAMKPETAGRLERLLCAVVDSGTGNSASIPNVLIAGKTGTAQKVKDDGTGYEKGRYISSFIGYVADREPKILCLVMIDSPKGLYYGSQVAAPVFKRIVNRMLNMGDSPWPDRVADSSENKKHGRRVLPDFEGESVHDAVAALLELGLYPKVVGDSTLVARQMPAAGSSLREGSGVTLYSDALTVESGNRVRVPQLKGKTVREAIQYLVQAQLKVNVSGSGVVCNQKPPAGALVEQGTTCMILCEKR